MNAELGVTERITAKAQAHQAMYPSFNLARYLSLVRGEGEAYMKWAAGQTTKRVNDSVKFRNKDAGGR